MTYEHKVINEKRSFTEYTVSSPTQSFVIGFELYEDEQNIHLTLNNTPIADLGYTFAVINSLTVEVTPAIPSGVLRIQRETDIDENKHKFSAGAIFNALSMDENFAQIRNSQQETRDGFSNLSDRVVPLVDGLEEALTQAATASQAAQEAADAAEEAADAAEEAAQTTRSASQVIDESGLTQQEINNTNKALLHYLTPEMFGAVGDGVTDDYRAIQDMLDAGAVGCTFEFDGSKTYYNAFGNFTPLSPWLDEDDRPQWTRRKRCTFKFNGAKLTRRRPDWNTNNAVNDGNTGAYYTDDRTALLKCVGTGTPDDVWYMYGANFDSNVPLGWLYNHVTGLYDIGDGSYGAGTCMDWGLRLENIGVFKGVDCSFQKSCFPVSGVNLGYISMNGLTLKYAAQARYRTNDVDPGAFGGGIKLENCKNFYLDNVYGYKNANDTVELERYNGYGFVRGRSEYDINQSFMIYSSHDLSVDWQANNIIRGSGFTIKASGAGSNSSNVRGKIVLDTVYGTGLDIIIDADYDRDLTGIDLDLQTTNCGYGGLQIVNNSATYMPKGLKINHIDYNGNTWLNASRRFVGKMSGVITGANYAINGYAYPANFKGFVVEGTNTKDSCLTMTLDLTPIPLVWQVAETAFVSLRNTVTSWGVFNLTADRQNINGGCNAGLHYPYNASIVSSSEFTLDGGKFKAVNLTSIASENGQVYVDLSSGVNVGSGIAYNVKIFKTT